MKLDVTRVVDDAYFKIRADIIKILENEDITPFKPKKNKVFRKVNSVEYFANALEISGYVGLMCLMVEILESTEIPRMIYILSK